MSLPCKKIFIDTKHKTPDSVDTSNFKIELPDTVYMPNNTIFYITDLAIPHSWYTIDEGWNRLYIQVSGTSTNPGNKPNECRTIILRNGTYSITSLAAEIQYQANAYFSTTNIPTHFSVSADIVKNQIVITPVVSTILFKVLTDQDLKTGMANLVINGWLGAWNGPAYDYNNPGDINELIGNHGGAGLFHSGSNPFVSGYVDLQYIKNVYLHSANLGNFQTIMANPRGSRNIIKKIPVSAPDNQMIIYSESSSADWLECSKQTLKTLEFVLRDARGNQIPLHNSNVSFSIVFEKYKDMVEG